MKKSKQKELIKNLTCEILNKFMIMYSAVENHYSIKLSVIFDDFDNIEDFIEYVQKLYLDIEEVI